MHKCTQHLSLQTVSRADVLILHMCGRNNIWLHECARNQEIAYTQRTTILQTHHDNKSQSYRYQGPLIQRGSGGWYVLSSSSNVFLWSVLVSFFPSAVSQSPPAVWHWHPWPWSICAPPPCDCALKISQILSPLSPHFMTIWTENERFCDAVMMNVLKDGQALFYLRISVLLF